MFQKPIILITLLTILLTAWPVASAQTDGLSFMDMDHVVICPATPDEGTPPDFSSDRCWSGTAADIDPQGNLIWVQATIMLDRLTGPAGEPLALYISGKMSSEVHLNGERVGLNGQPGADAESETPGKMDAELHPSQALFRAGANELVFKASSHNGFVRLYRPFHIAGIAPAGALGSGALQSSGTALVTLGVFLLGALYFGVMAFMGSSTVRFATLSAICLFAGGQLLSETLRALVQYAYPVHDLRLIAITIFSGAFGLGVAFHIFRTFWPSNALRVSLALGGVGLIVVLAVPGFDYRALAAMTLPLLVSLLATGLWTYQARPRAFLHFVSLLIFLGAILLFRALFLDTVFFLLVAFFLFLLFIDQALTLADEARQRRSEEARANRLEQALAEVNERTEAGHIQVKSAGKMERIATTDIVHCQGASGYSELILRDGRTLLHGVSLNELEETLPATFLRVHRSHLINVTFVKSLARDPAGTGTLTLDEGSEIPVSRRIMPKVRQALA